MIVIFLSYVGHQPEGVGPDYTMSPSLLPSHCGSFFKPLVWKIFSSSLRVIFIDSCSVSGCNFGVFMGGSEFRVFLTLPFWPPLQFLFFH